MNNDTGLRPVDVFLKQIECIRDDDRDAQLRLYADDCIYEFPFATDRPRRMEGREQIKAVMVPMWSDARAAGFSVTGCESKIFDTTDPEVIVAEFTLAVEGRGAVFQIPFVQVLRVRSGRIVEIREYFSPVMRNEAVSQ